MNTGTAYALGVLTPFAVLTVWVVWDWGLEGLNGWWHRQRPTLGRIRCLIGHAYGADGPWVVCRRCGHAYLVEERAS